MTKNKRKVLANRVDILGTGLSGGSAMLALSLLVNDGVLLMDNLLLSGLLLTSSLLLYVVVSLVLMELAD